MLKKQKAIIHKHAKISLEIFDKDPDDPELDTHPLKDELKNYWSIHIVDNADWSAIYEEIDGTVAYFVAIGDHKTLYRDYEKLLEKLFPKGR